MAPTDDQVPDLEEWRAKMERNVRSAIRYYDRQGNPLTLDEWIRLSDFSYKRVALSAVGPYVVSTVWLGLDHGFSFYDDAPPIIFETMVFVRSRWEGEGEDHYMGEMDGQRYSTEDQAVAGHKETVETVAASAQDVDGSSYEIEWEYEG